MKKVEVTYTVHCDHCGKLISTHTSDREERDTITFLSPVEVLSFFTTDGTLTKKLEMVPSYTLSSPYSLDSKVEDYWDLCDKCQKSLLVNSVDSILASLFLGETSSLRKSIPYLAEYSENQLVAIRNKAKSFSKVPSLLQDIAQKLHNHFKETIVEAIRWEEGSSFIARFDLVSHKNIDKFEETYFTLSDTSKSLFFEVYDSIKALIVSGGEEVPMFTKKQEKLLRRMWREVAKEKRYEFFGIFQYYNIDIDYIVPEFSLKKNLTTI
jgi:hypothetical protein